MKNVYRILLVVLLSAQIVYAGTGINIVRCAHSGAVSMVHGLGGYADHTGCDRQSSGCMSVEHVQLSPTQVVQSTSYDFHPVLFVLASLPCQTAVWHQPSVQLRPVVIHKVWKSPPRDYLNLIRILLI